MFVRLPMRPRRRASIAVVGGVALVVACGGGSGSAPRAAAPTAGSATGTSAHITIKGFAFQPTTLTVQPGERVSVRNDDQVPHTVTANDKSFDTGDIPGKSTAAFTAPRAPGTYAYICTIHPYMKGTLVVRG